MSAGLIRVLAAFGACLTWALDIGLPLLAGLMVGETLWIAVHGDQGSAAVFGAIAAGSIRAAIWFQKEREKEGV